MWHGRAEQSSCRNFKSKLRLFADSGTKRIWRPMAALLGKELQLHSVSLFCAGVLLVLHIGVFFLRILYANSHRNTLAAVVSEFFWVAWLVLPLVIGGTAVAEERKLGVTEGQFCLPVSRRLQFAIKFIPAMIFGTLLGGVMPCCWKPWRASRRAKRFFKLETMPAMISSDLFGSKSRLSPWRRDSRWRPFLPRRSPEFSSGIGLCHGDSCWLFLARFIHRSYRCHGARAFLL